MLSSPNWHSNTYFKGKLDTLDSALSLHFLLSWKVGEEFRDFVKLYIGDILSERLTVCLTIEVNCLTVRVITN